MTVRSLIVTAFCVVLAPALAPTAQAQEATLTGAITDTTDAVLPGVALTVVNIATGNTFSAVSDASGVFRISAIRVGNYRITAELPGFTSVTRENVQVLVGQELVIDMKMSLASVSESVTVSSQAPLIDTTQSKLGGNVDPRQLQALPVNGRNWMQLTMLAPGSRANDTGQSPTGLGTDGSQRTDPGYFQLVVDGQQVTNAMAQASYGQPKYARDSIGEFQFVSGRFDATNGRSIGILVNAVTKSGTNLVSGSGYGYFRDDTFNGADFVAKRVLPYSNQQIGATIGGPLIRDRMHIFGYYEREREPTTLAFTSRFPTFNIADLQSTRVEQTSGIRLDLQMSEQTRLMIRANGWRNNLPVDPFGFASSTGHPAQNYSRLYQSGQVYGALTKLFGSNVVNEIKPGMHLTSSDQTAICCKEGPTINLAGYTIGKGGSWPLRLWPHIWAVRDDLTMVVRAAGRHELKLGGDFSWNHDFLEWNVNRFGVLQANGGPIPANIESLFPVWDDPSTWNLAPLSPISVRWTQSFSHCSDVSGGCGWSWVNVTKEAAAWFQDNWAVTPRLTLNLGVRWDLGIDWAGQNLEFAPLHYKSKNDFNNIAPRLGAAYSLPDRKTVLRGGWGKYFVGVKDQWQHHIKGNIQLANVAVLNDGRPDFAVNPFNGSITTYEQAVVLVHDTVGSVISNTAQVPYAYQASIGMQRQLHESMSFQVDYSWNAGRHEQNSINTNLSYNPATGVNYPFSDVSRRPWQYLGITSQYFTLARSNYHALETAFSKRFSNQWQASFTYTLSQFKDFVPPPYSGETEITFPLAPDIGGNWAYAVGDQRHRAVFNGIWELPYQIQLSGLYHYGSGQQWGSNWGTDIRNSGNAFQRLRPDGTVVPRDDLYGTPLHRVDLRVLRRFTVYGRSKLEGSLEMFNIFNHANYGTFVTQQVNALYGQPQLNKGTAYQPRMFQLGFRVTF